MTSVEVVWAVLIVLGAAAYSRRIISRAVGRAALWQSASFSAGLAVMAVSAPGSTIFGLGMFADHMVRHLLLILVAPVLLVAGLSPPVLRSQEARAAQPTGRKALVVFLLYAVAIVGTHLTPAAADVMTSVWTQLAEHLAYLAAGCLYWTVVLGRGVHSSLALRCALIVVAMPIDTFCGVALMMTGRPVGTATLADVHLGGAIMWFGGDGLMAVLLVLVFVVGSRKGDDTALLGSYVAQARRAAWGAGPPGKTVTAGAEDAEQWFLDSYNARLAQLAAREEQLRPRRGSGGEA